MPSLHLDSKTDTPIETFRGLYLEQPRPLPFHLTLPFISYLSQADETATLNIMKICTVQMGLNLIYSYYNEDGENEHIMLYIEHTKKIIQVLEFFTTFG